MTQNSTRWKKNIPNDWRTDTNNWLGWNFYMSMKVEDDGDNHDEAGQENGSDDR